MAELPAVDWTQRADLAALVAALGEGRLRWVGGCVRDTLLGAPVHDIDAATTLRPEQVIAACEEAGIRTVPTGIEHGTVTAVMDGSNVEITTLRRDVATDGRRATVAFADDWREDAARRDFTINALYADPATLAVSDYFGGLDDLEARRVRFIGDPRDRIAEDHLRILRYYRFQARFGAALDDAAEEACAEMAPTLKGLSRERVGWELRNLLGLPDPHATIARMFSRDVLSVVLPEVDAAGLERLAALIAHERSQDAEPDALRRLSAMLPPDRAVATDVAARLRLSKSARARLQCAAEREAGDADHARALAYRHGLDCARDRVLLEGGSLAPLDGWTIPTLPLKGGEIVARGVAAGPDVARILQAVERRWIAEGFPERTRVLALLDAEMNG